MKEKKQKEIKPGEPLKQNTIMTLSVTCGLAALCLFVGLIWVKDSAKLFVPAGIVIFLFGVICTAPNLIGFFRGKKRERLIKQGKIVEEKKKDFNPNHRWGD